MQESGERLRTLAAVQPAPAGPEGALTAISGSGETEGRICTYNLLREVRSSSTAESRKECGMALEDRWSELTEEQKAKAKGCRTPEELLSLAREEGYELSEDELGAVAGGIEWFCDNAPCGSYVNPCSNDSRI